MIIAPLLDTPIIPNVFQVKPLPSKGQSMSKPLTDISFWMQEHMIELSPAAYLSLEGLLRKYHHLKPPAPMAFPVMDMGDDTGFLQESGKTP